MQVGKLEDISGQNRNSYIIHAVLIERYECNLTARTDSLINNAQLQNGGLTKLAGLGYSNRALRNRRERERERARERERERGWLVCPRVQIQFSFF